MEVDKEESHILKGCLKGRREEQRALYECHKARMFALCLRYARCNADAEDMLQEGFLKVFRDLHQYKPEAPLGAWIRKVMINTALEHIRSNKKPHENDHDNIRLLQLESQEGVHDALNTKELRRRIAELPDDFRTVFNLYAIEGYSHQEISEMLHISVANSKVRLNRARRILKRSILETNQYYTL
jgi:RNA polymerase sigma-70 factor (ECF subfamily)